VVFTTCISIALSSCSSGRNPNSTYVSNFLTNSYSSVISQIENVLGDSGLLLSGSIAIYKKDLVTLAAPNFGTTWETIDVMSNPINGLGLITVKEYMGIQLLPSTVYNTDSSLPVNFFGRVNSALGALCATGVGAGLMNVRMNADFNLQNGNHTIVFTEAIKARITTQCGLNLSSISNGTSSVITVADSSDNFSKVYSLSYTASDDDDLSQTQTFYVKSTATEVNIAISQEYGDLSVARTLIFWNKTTRVLRIEYVADPGDSFTPGQSRLYAYRMYYDETLDQAQIFAYDGPDNNASAAIRYILAGKPSTGDAFSLSFKQGDVESGSKLEACVNSSTGSMITDGARCIAGSNRLNGAAIDGTADTVITNFYSDRGDSTWSNLLPTTGLSWSNMTDMLSTTIDP
jgi:hypothetical protein